MFPGSTARMRVPKIVKNCDYFFLVGLGMGKPRSCRMCRSSHDLPSSKRQGFAYQTSLYQTRTRKRRMKTVLHQFRNKHALYTKILPQARRHSFSVQELRYRSAACLDRFMLTQSVMPYVQAFFFTELQNL